MSVWLLCTCFKFRIRWVLKRQLGLNLSAWGLFRLATVTGSVLAGAHLTRHTRPRRARMNDASVNYFWCLITSRLCRSACVNCVSNIRTRSSATADGPRDAACQSKYQLLHNCRNKLYKSRTSEVIGLEYYVWTTCSKQPRHVDRRRCGQQARPSTSFVDDLIDLPWQNFWVRDKVPQKS